MIDTGLMRYHIRCVTQPPIDGQSLAGGSSTAEGAASAPQASGRQREGETASAATGADADADSDGDGGAPNGRGSKTQVLADLAKERDKRQILDKENAALKARLAEFGILRARGGSSEGMRQVRAAYSYSPRSGDSSPQTTN